jgi:EAL domain-containing protein (putative c-di-GMP-specific phosphodiesterase class I)
MYEQLLRLGCDSAQGRFIAEPARAQQARDWIARQGALGLL